MFRRQFEVKFQPALHRLVDAIDDVLRQVLVQIHLRNLVFISVNYLVNPCYTLVASSSKVDISGVVTHHPHSENESQSRVVAPKTRHVPDLETGTRKRHAGIADYEGCIVAVKHLAEIWRTRG